MATIKQRISNCLWFDSQAEEAARFYSSVFPNSSMGAITRYDKEGHDIHGQKEGNVMTATFTLDGYEITALNGGPLFKMNPSVSFFVVCESVKETEKIWEKLAENGKVLMALDKYDWSEKYGWVQDRFGLSWQLSTGNIAEAGQWITPSLLFVKEQAGRAEEAIDFYTSIFDNSKIKAIHRYDANDHDKEGTIKHAQFSLSGQQFVAMDSGMDHKFVFNEAISFIVYCNSQKEIDYYWNKLTQGGKESQCGWLQDKFGLSWQVEPIQLTEMLRSPDKEKRERVTHAFMRMKKFDLAKLQQAFEKETSLQD